MVLSSTRVKILYYPLLTPKEDLSQFLYIFELVNTLIISLDRPHCEDVTICVAFSS